MTRQSRRSEAQPSVQAATGVSDLAKATDARLPARTRPPREVESDQSEACISASGSTAASSDADCSRVATAGGSAVVPTPRIHRNPTDQLDYDDRHKVRATSDDQVLKRYIKLGWHETAQHFITSLGPVAFCFSIYLFVRWTGVPPAEAVKIGLFGLVSSAAGVGLHGVGRALWRRVDGRKKDHRDDASAS
jgi:hypothetical protein